MPYDRDAAGVPTDLDVVVGEIETPLGQKKTTAELRDDLTEKLNSYAEIYALPPDGVDITCRYDAYIENSKLEKMVCAITEKMRHKFKTPPTL